LVSLKLFYKSKICSILWGWLVHIFYYIYIVVSSIDSYETAAAKEIQIYMSESENDEDILRRGKRLKVDNKKNTQSLDFNNDSECNNFITS